MSIDIEKMRAKFEAWASDNGAYPSAVQRNGDDYLLAVTHSYWSAWKACAASGPSDQDDYKAWYDEAMVASNEAGFVGMSAAETIRALAAAERNEGPPLAIVASGLTDERIDYIADVTVRGMEDGIRGFMKVWGWRHFARALIAACEPAPQPAERKPLTDEEITLIHDREACLPDLVGLKRQWPEILRFARAIEHAHGIGREAVE